MKREYEKPQISEELIDERDIITSSTPDGEDNDVDIEF